MSKFKNKKALALSVGAIMAGVSVIGVVAACAPTKAKPAKPTEKKVEQPQTSGTESSKQGSGSTTNTTGQGSGTGGTTNANPGSGSTTTGTKQGSETGGTTNSTPGATNPGEQGSNNGGTTNSPGGSANVSPETPSTPQTTPKNDTPSVGASPETNKNDPAPSETEKQTEQPSTPEKPNPSTTKELKASLDSTSTKLNKIDEGYELSLLISNADQKFVSVQLTKIVANGVETTTHISKAKVQVVQNKAKVIFTDLEDDSNYKVSMVKVYSSLTGTKKDATIVPIAEDLLATKFTTQKALIADTTSPSISLSDNTNLIKSENDYTLSLNVLNADAKYIEVELQQQGSDVASIIKSKEKVKIEANMAIVSFSGLVENATYKIVGAKLYASAEATDSVEINIDEELKNRKLTTGQLLSGQPRDDLDQVVIKENTFVAQEPKWTSETNTLQISLDTDSKTIEYLKTKQKGQSFLLLKGDLTRPNSLTSEPAQFTNDVNSSLNKAIFFEDNKVILKIQFKNKKNKSYDGKYVLKQLSYLEKENETEKLNINIPIKETQFEASAVLPQQSQTVDPSNLTVESRSWKEGTNTLEIIVKSNKETIDYLKTKQESQAFFRLSVTKNDQPDAHNIDIKKLTNKWVFFEQKDKIKIFVQYKDPKFNANYVVKELSYVEEDGTKERQNVQLKIQSLQYKVNVQQK